MDDQPPSTPTDEQHDWASSFCGVDTRAQAETGGDSSSASSSTDDQSGDTSAGTSADNASGATPAFDADSFYQQTLQSSGYTLGGNPCLDQCWTDFQACLKTTNDPNQCLAQLTACQRSCGQQQQTSSGSGSTGDPTTTAADTSRTSESGDGSSTDDQSGNTSAGTSADNADAGVVLTSGGQLSSAATPTGAQPSAANQPMLFNGRMLLIIHVVQQSRHLP